MNIILEFLLLNYYQESQTEEWEAIYMKVEHYNCYH